MGKRSKTTENDITTESDASGAPRDKTASQSRLMTYSVIIAAILVILAGIHAARSILGPFLMATFTTVLLISPINWLKKRGFSSASSMTVVIIGVVICGLVCTTIIGGQIAQFAKNLPEYRDKFNDTLKSYNIGIEEFLPQFLRSDDEKETLPEDETQSETQPEEESSPKAPRESSAPQVEDLQSAKAADQASSSTPSEIKDEKEAKDASGSLNSATALASYAEESESDQTAEPEPSALDAPANNVPNRNPGGGERSIFDNVNSPFTPLPATSALIPQVEDHTDAINALDEPSGAGRSENQDDADEFERHVTPRPITAVDASSQGLFHFLGSLAGELSYVASTAFIVMLLVVFMLIETANIPKKLVDVLGQRRFTSTHIEGVIRDIRSYMVIKTQMSILIGVSVTVLLMATKVDYPLLWGFVAFLLNYIPNIGSVVAAIPPIVLATVNQGFAIGCIDCAAITALNCTVGYVLEPKLLGRGLGLSPLIVLMSLIFFGWLLGPVGMFLSPPLAVVMKIIFQAFPETRWIAALMANKPLSSIEKDNESPSLDS